MLEEYTLFGADPPELYAHHQNEVEIEPPIVKAQSRREEEDGRKEINGVANSGIEAPRYEISCLGAESKGFPEIHFGDTP